jgi:hypothetical protein
VVGRFRANRETTQANRPAGYAGEAYLALILELLAEETRARDSIERRAAGVLAAMAVIVTVIATLAAGGTLDNVQFERWTSFFGVEAAVLLLFSGAFAWRAILPRRYKVAKRSELRRIAESEVFWSGDPRIGTRRSAESLLDSLDSAREANGHKAWDLAAAMGLALLGVALLASSAVAFVRSV